MYGRGVAWLLGLVGVVLVLAGCEVRVGQSGPVGPGPRGPIPVPRRPRRLGGRRRRCRYPGRHPRRHPRRHLGRRARRGCPRRRAASRPQTAPAWGGPRQDGDGDPGDGRAGDAASGRRAGVQPGAGGRW